MSQRRGPTTKTPAVVGLTALRNCLVNLPSGLVSVLVASNTPAQNVVIELSWRVKAPPSTTAGPVTGPATITRQAFAGWTGMPSKRQPLQPQGPGSFPGSQRSNSLEGCVEIDSAFARNVGLTEGSKVNILLHVDPPTTHTIHIEPLTASDWEIIELHATFLELNLLSQIRAITFAHPLTVYLSPTSTASIKVTKIEPEDAASSFGFAKISPDAEVIVAPKTRQRRMSHVGKSVKAKSLASTRQGKRRDDGSGSSGGPVFFRAITLPHESFDIAEEQKGAYCVYLDPEVLAIPTLRGCAFVSVVVVRPPGLAPPVDMNQPGNDAAGEASPDAPEIIKPSLRIVARLLPWKNAPDLKHIAVSNLLADALDIKNVVGCVIRTEAAHQQLPKGSTTKVIIRPYAASTLTPASASEQSSLRWSGKDWKSDLAVRRVKEALSQKSVWGEDILGGPLSDRLVLPAIPDSPLFAGGILLLDGSEVRHGWILGGDRKYILELGSEITTPRPHVPLSISETALPVLPPGSIVGVDKAIESSLNVLTRSASVLLTGARGSGKTSLVSVITSVLKTKHFFHVLPISCAKFADERLQNIKDTFSRAIAEAKWFSPTVIVFDDLDRMIPAEVEHADSTRSRYIAEAFGRVVRDLRASVPGPGNVVILATVQAKESVNSLVVGGHIFREIVTLKAPNKDGRRKVLEKAAGSTPDDKSAETNMGAGSMRSKNPGAIMSVNRPDTTLRIERGLDMLEIAGMTDGYMPADLQLLVGRARHEAIVRMVEVGNDETGEELTLTRKDFDTAIKGFVPAGLRGVKLQTGGAAWKDIGGLLETRKILLETLEWPTRYAPIFANCPLRLRSGLLLYGYPGCGKTLLASAVSGECGLNFISVKGPEILNKYIGASEKSVRDLFERASAAKPCVLFFDEFDSIAPKRGHDSTGVTDRVVNQMLTQMDGAEGLDGVYVLAATSRPDLIDPALLRPGRLDKSLLCDLPNHEERVDILRALSLKLKVEESIELEDIGNLTEGFSGADLQALLYNAHLEAIHDVIASQEAEVERFGKGKGKGKVDGGAGNEMIDYISFSMGGDKEEAAETSTLTNGTQAARTRFAERATVMAKLDKLKKMVQADGGKHQQQSTNQLQEEEKDDDEVVISWKHLQSSLKSTRPSISPDERKRLHRIYNEFIVGRSGEMPTGQSSTEIGGRSSLM
ncbi:hypothetical protein ABW20_dc0103125 [Dactylellina cionopaga]|nr:hypothetical protein ABW20_dc0103125 [Dactylellina cionopaga]